MKLLQDIITDSQTAFCQNKKIQPESKTNSTVLNVVANLCHGSEGALSMPLASTY
jgi:hypothetical protein